MKIKSLLLIIPLLVFSSVSFSQDTKLTLNLRNVTVLEFFKDIEQNTKYRFFYDSGELNLNDKVTIVTKDAGIEDVLDQIFRDSEITYEILDRHIILHRKRGDRQAEGNIFIQKTGVSGKVTDENGDPLQGVTVVLKETNNGTYTDENGEYYLADVPVKGIIQFSFVGLKTKSVAINNQTEINVQLGIDAIGIEEVIAIGYGTRKKADLTGAVSQLESDDFVKAIAMSPQQSVQGKLPGVYVSNTGSDPTARPTVRIRGISTLGNNNPLYVVDGVPLTEGGQEGMSGNSWYRGSVNVLNLINPNDIESISVLKDATATAIYGVRASNGVVLINTKRGVKGKTRINLSARYGVQNIFNKYELLNTQQYVEMFNEAWSNNTAFREDPDILRFFNPSSAAYLGNSPTYDWQQATRVKNAVVQDYNVSITGGNDASSFAAGAGFSGKENASYRQIFERYSFYFNSDHAITDWLKMGESFRFAYSWSDSDASGSIWTAPWQPLYDSSGPDGFATPWRVIEGEHVNRGYGPGTGMNPYGNAIYRKDPYELVRSMGSFYAEINPLKNLRVRGTYGFDYYLNHRQNYYGARYGLFLPNEGRVIDDGNTYRNVQTINGNTVKELLTGYTAKIGNHSFDVILNAMAQRVIWNTRFMMILRNSPIASWDQRRVEEFWEDGQGSYERQMRQGLIGYMGRLSYNYNSKYYLDFTYRRDGSSKFAPGYKWGDFPSVGLAWRISSEPFMSDIKWLDDLKLRTGWGQAGNQETRDYAFISLVNFEPRYFTDAGGPDVGDGTPNPAAVLGDFPIVDMSWETVTSINIGLDAGFFDNRLGFTAEYFYKMTDGILQSIQIPLVIGALNDPVVNLAQIENKGWEFKLDYYERFGGLGVNGSVNITTIRNKVKKLYNGRPQGENLRIEEGYSLQYIYGYKLGGIFQTPGEVEEWMQSYSDPGNESQKSPGDIWFEDLHSAPDPNVENQWVGPEPDGIINQYDRTYLGKTIPGFYYGIHFRMDYKKWDLTLNFRGVGDVQKINYTRWSRENMTADGPNQLASVLNRWTPENPSTSMPRAIANDPSGNNRFSDRWVEDAGFFRLQNTQLGYTTNPSFLKRIGISSSRFYVSGSNLFVVTPYSDLDPENNTTPTTFMAGVDFNF